MSDPWAGILATGEQILWQGAPASRLRLEWDTVFHPVFFLVFTGFSIFWMIMAAQAGGTFWMFGLLFFFVGAYNLVGVHYWRHYQRQHTYYTLTDRRAFIARDLFGRKSLDSYPITDRTQISLVQGTDTGDVYFAEKVTRSRNGTTTRRIGFEQIPDARDVLGLMRQVQAGAA